MKPLWHIIKRRRTFITHRPSIEGPFIYFSSQNHPFITMTRVEPYFFEQAFYFALLTFEDLYEGPLVEQEHSRHISLTVVVPCSTQDFVERIRAHFRRGSADVYQLKYQLSCSNNCTTT